MPVSQGKLALGFSLGICADPNDDTYYSAIMLNEVLGGSASSKLFLNVREKLSLCYYCSSSYSIYSGTLLISSGFEVKNHAIAKKAIFEQIDDIKQGKISDAELLAAKRTLSNACRQLYDNPFELQVFLGNRALFGITDGVEAFISKFMSVTKEDIVAVAQNIKFEASYFIEGTSASESEEEQYE
jgi:predicted Zn-dependent peptidase